MIHYIGLFSKFESTKRDVAPSTVNEMHYVATKLHQLGIDDVNIYGCAFRQKWQERFAFLKSDCYSLTQGVNVKEAAIIDGKKPLLKFIGLLFMHFQLLLYLFFTVKRNDIIVVYHSMLYAPEMKLMHMVRGVRIIMEVEELYSALQMKSLKSEIKYLSLFDGYIYVNDIMNNRFNFNKPYAVCYGDYSISPNFVDRNSMFLKNIVYAGFLGTKGSDVDLAINIMNYLPEDYILKIAGWGKQQSVNYVNKSIELRNNITYHGCLSGEEYESFLKTVGIGLCTRVLPNQYSDYTFPSKVLTYLNHGIIPVCPPLSCLLSSSVKDYILFYDDNTPDKIAAKLLEVKKFDSPEAVLKKLDSDFLSQLRILLIGHKDR